MKKEASVCGSSWSMLFLPLCPSSFTPSFAQAASAAAPRGRLRPTHSPLALVEMFAQRRSESLLDTLCLRQLPPCPHCSERSGRHRPNPPSNPIPKPLPWMALRPLSRLHSAHLGCGLSYGVFYRLVFTIWDASAPPCRFLLASTRAFQPPLCAFSKCGAV